MRYALAVTALCLLALCLAAAGCHPNPPGTHGLTLADVNVILVDADAGISISCGEGWLSPDQCALARRVWDDAEAAIGAATTGGWGPVAKAVLMTEEAKLPADSRLRPYFDAAIALL